MYSSAFIRIISRLFDILLLLLCLVFAEQLIFHSAVVSAAVVSSLQLCVDTVIPSLFCFMVLTSFLSSCKFGAWLSLPMLPLCRMLCLPLHCGSILLMSMIGGYPAGVKALSDAWKRKEIDDRVLKRMLVFSVCPAPSFVIIAVGCHMLKNQSAGLLLYSAQILSAQFLALLSSVLASVQSKQQLSRLSLPKRSMSYSEALVEAVLFSSHTLLGMCGFILLFAVVSALLRQLPISEEIYALIYGFFEISGSSGKLAELSVPYKLNLLSFFLSFGGLSVQFQLKSILKDCPCSFPRLFLGRCAHGMCSALFTSVLLSCFPQAKLAFSADPAPLQASDPSTPLLSLCLIGMIAILLTNFHRKVTENR